MKTFIPLGELAEFVNGRAFKPSEWTTKGRPIIRIQNLTGTNGSFNYFDGPVDERVLVRKGDILISWSASLGVYRWNGPDAVLNQHIFKVNLGDGIRDDYFFYAATNALNEMTARVHGSTMQHITKDRFDSIGIPVPQIDSQKRAANLLRSVDELRRIRRHALESNDELLPAAFLEMFCHRQDNWPRVKIDELAAKKPNAIRTGPFGSQLLHSEFTSNGIAVLGIDNAVNNRFEWAERRYISPKKYLELERYTVSPGDVIITIMGTCGRCAVIPDNIPAAINTKHLCCITLDQEKALPSFIQAAFLYHPLIRHQLGVAEKGAVMDGLNMGIIKELSLPIPPIELQRIFATFAKRQENLRAIHIEALRQADHLFRTLLHQTFSS